MLTVAESDFEDLPPPAVAAAPVDPAPLSVTASAPAEPAPAAPWGATVPVEPAPTPTAAPAPAEPAPAAIPAEPPAPATEEAATAPASTGSATSNRPSAMLSPKPKAAIEGWITSSAPAKISSEARSMDMLRKGRAASSRGRGHRQSATGLML